MDIRRVLDRYDRLIREGNPDEAERILIYWLKEAETTGDANGRFSILNEMTGFYRTMKKQEEAFKVCEELLGAAEHPGCGVSDTARATAYLNAATVYNSFGESGKAVGLYGRTLEIYKKVLKEDDYRLAALYNNMALAVMAHALKEEEDNIETACGKEIKDNGLEKAAGYFESALEILKKRPGFYNELAITYLNMADLEEKRMGMEAGEEQILKYVEKAEALLDKSCDDKDPDFKETAVKCLDAFKKYGHFAYAARLEERIREMS